VPDRDASAEVTRAVAANLRALRARRGWSLDQLAQRAGVSKGVLVALEGDRGNPSLNTLIRVADAFAVSLTELVQTGPAPALRVASIEDATVLWRGAHGGSGKLVLSTDPPTPVELWVWRLEPGESKDSEPHNANTEEAVLVLAGELTVHAGEQTVRVPAGSAVTFPGDAPHAYRNNGEVPAEYLAITTVPQ
jgi:transcriptional regulator with XRE-family HTH domain